MTYRLGQLSVSHLENVDPPLVRCVQRAIEITLQDFGVYEGLRAIERQRELFKAGASRTMNSYHLPDRYGIGHATDLVPWIGGKLQWQSAPCNQIAKAMHQASLEQDYPIVWGAVWDRKLHELDPDNLEREIAAYVRRYQQIHGFSEYPLIDRPHYQGERSADALPSAA
jgi:peptidoglycan L-alanyl-D-glutamate endopeptidase CwlK